MANTYTQLHIHAVFSPKYRDAVIHSSWEDELYRYLTGAVQAYDHKMLQINGMPDHIHMLFGMRPTQGLSDLMKTIKEESSRWINRQGFVPGTFRWQSGFGAFSVEKVSIPRIARYIERQKQHHAHQQLKFREEYRRILERHGVEYDERYIFRELV